MSPLFNINQTTKKISILKMSFCVCLNSLLTKITISMLLKYFFFDFQNIQAIYIFMNCRQKLKNPY